MSETEKVDCVERVEGLAMEKSEQDLENLPILERMDRGLEETRKMEFDSPEGLYNYLRDGFGEMVAEKGELVAEALEKAAGYGENLNELGQKIEGEIGEMISQAGEVLEQTAERLRNNEIIEREHVEAIITIVALALMAAISPEMLLEFLLSPEGQQAAADVINTFLVDGPVS